jgi:hypothetical protein
MKQSSSSFCAQYIKILFGLCTFNAFPSINFLFLIHNCSLLMFPGMFVDILYDFFELFQVLLFPVKKLYPGLPPHKIITRWFGLHGGQSWIPCRPVYYPGKWPCSHVITSFQDEWVPYSSGCRSVGIVRSRTKATELVS